MKKIIIVLVLVMTVSLGYVFAQERTITGMVTAAEDGSPIPGVNVILKGTTKSTTTNAKGKYSLTVPSRGTLVFSFIGYVTSEVAIGINNVINVTITADVKALSEVVVKGYDMDQRLQGRVAGVQIGKSKSRDGGKSMAPSGFVADYEQQPNWNTESYNSMNENIFHDALSDYSGESEPPFWRKVSHPDLRV